MKKLHIFVLVTLMATPVLAHAHGGVVYSYAPSGAQQFQSMVKTSATDPITKAFAQVTDGLKNVLVRSNADIATQMEQRQIDAIKKERAAQAMQEQQPATDACGGQTSAAYAKSVVDVSQAIASRYKAGARQRSGNAPATPEQALMAENTHARTYCDSETAPGKTCQVQPKRDSISGEPLKAADVKAESLFAGAGEDGRKGNLTYSQDQVEAARQYINNVIDTSDAPRKPTPSEYSSPEGKKYEGLRQVYMARVSMAQDTMSNILAMRTPVPDSKRILDEIKAGSPVGGADIIAEREAEVRRYSRNGDLSPLELLDLEVRRRVDNPAWYEAINTQANPASLAREQTFMLAMMLKMQYLQYRQGEGLAALNAQQSVEAAKTGMRDKLTQAEAAMLRGTGTAR